MDRGRGRYPRFPFFRFSRISLAGIAALLLLASSNGYTSAATKSSNPGEADNTPFFHEEYYAPDEQQALEVAARRLLSRTYSNAVHDDWTVHPKRSQGRRLAVEENQEFFEEDEAGIYDGQEDIPSDCFGEQYVTPAKISLEMTEFDLGDNQASSSFARGGKYPKMTGYIAADMENARLEPQFSAIPQVDQSQRLHSYRASKHHLKRTVYAFQPNRPRNFRSALADVEVGHYFLMPSIVRVYDPVVYERSNKAAPSDARQQDREVPRMLIQKMMIKAGAYVYLRRPDGILKKHKRNGRDADIVVTRTQVRESRRQAHVYEIRENRSNGRLLARVGRRARSFGQAAQQQKKGLLDTADIYSMTVSENTDKAMIFTIMVAIDGLNHDGSAERLAKRARYAGAAVATAAVVAGAAHGAGRYQQAKRMKMATPLTMETLGGQSPEYPPQPLRYIPPEQMPDYQPSLRNEAEGLAPAKGEPAKDSRLSWYNGLRNRQRRGDAQQAPPPLQSQDSWQLSDKSQDYLSSATTGFQEGATTGGTNEAQLPVSTNPSWQFDEQDDGQPLMPNPSWDFEIAEEQDKHIDNMFHGW